jgi:hypothetical protein
VDSSAPEHLSRAARPARAGPAAHLLIADHLSRRLRGADGPRQCGLPAADPIDAGAVVALPVIEGPWLPGLPFDERGFIPIART